MKKMWSVGALLGWLAFGYPIFHEILTGGDTTYRTIVIFFGLMWLSLSMGMAYVFCSELNK